MNKTSMVTFATLAIGGAFGFILGRQSVPSPQMGRDPHASSHHSSAIPSRMGRSGDRTTGSGRHSKIRVNSVSEAIGLSEIHLRSKALIDYCARLDPSEYVQELHLIGDLALESERSMARDVLFGLWGEVDPVAAMRAAPTTYAFKAAFGGWASIHPLEAATHYDENPRDTLVNSFSWTGVEDCIAKEWARQDLSAAVTWAQSLSRDSVRDNALDGIFSVLKEDPVNGVIRLASIKRVENIQSLQKRLLQEWARHDPDAAAKWSMENGVE